MLCCSWFIEFQVLPTEPFIPLTEEEMALVSRAFSAKNLYVILLVLVFDYLLGCHSCYNIIVYACFCRRKVLVSHENSSIDIRGEILQCLKPGGWLNDEVVFHFVHGYIVLFIFRK